MRKWFTLLWLIAGVTIFAYHYNYGPEHIQRLEAWKLLQEIKEMEAQEDRDLNEILARYDDGETNSVPPDLVDLLPVDEDPMVFFQIRLAQNRLRMDSMDIATALNNLGELLKETSDAYGDDAPITRAVRETLGKSNYMAAWVLHGVGSPQKEWLPFAERARQIFRYLAEHKDAKAYQEYELKVAEALDRFHDSKKQKGLP